MKKELSTQEIVDIFKELDENCDEFDDDLDALDYLYESGITLNDIKMLGKHDLYVWVCITIVENSYNPWEE
jgi:hypothetical protein